MLPEKIEPKRSWALWHSYRDVELTRRIYTLEQTINALLSHLSEKEKEEGCRYHTWCNCSGLNTSPQEKETAFDIEVKRSEDCRKKVWDAEQRRTMDELSQHATDSSPQEKVYNSQNWNKSMQGILKAVWEHMADPEDAEEEIKKLLTNR